MPVARLGGAARLISTRLTALTALAIPAVATAPPRAVALLFTLPFTFLPLDLLAATDFFVFLTAAVSWPSGAT